jgi:hypothetical protein
LSQVLLGHGSRLGGAILDLITEVDHVQNFFDLLEENLLLVNITESDMFQSEEKQVPLILPYLLDKGCSARNTYIKMRLNITTRKGADYGFNLQSVL